MEAGGIQREVKGDGRVIRERQKSATSLSKRWPVFSQILPRSCQIEDAAREELLLYWREGQPHLTKISKLEADTREMVLVAEIERVPGSTVRVRFGGEDAEWINELDFMSWDLEKRWACLFC